MKRVLSILCLAATPASAVDGEPAPPPQTPTITCPEGMVWTPDTRNCEKIEDSDLDDTALYQAARELAYAGRLDDAAAALDAMQEDDSDRVLTYRGFVARKSGDWALAQRAYRAAIAMNPFNHLARSYYGMGLVDAGDLAAAQRQLDEIKARGGAASDAARLLSVALVEGSSAGY